MVAIWIRVVLISKGSFELKINKNAFSYFIVFTETHSPKEITRSDSAHYDFSFVTCGTQHRVVFEYNRVITDDPQLLFSPILQRRAFSPISDSVYKSICKSFSKTTPTSLLGSVIHPDLIERAIPNCRSFDELTKSRFGAWRFFIRKDTDGEIPNFEADGKKGVLVGAVFVPQEITSIGSFQEDISCIVLDSSFKFMGPYVFSIPSLYVNNTYFPLGISVHRSECKEIYKNFMMWLKLRSTST
jgi:hypothetical protein